MILLFLMLQIIEASSVCFFYFNFVKSYYFMGCDNQAYRLELVSDLQPATIVF